MWVKVGRCGTNVPSQLSTFLIRELPVVRGVSKVMGGAQYAQTCRTRHGAIGCASLITARADSREDSFLQKTAENRRTSHQAAVSGSSFCRQQLCGQQRNRYVSGRIHTYTGRQGSADDSVEIPERTGGWDGVDTQPCGPLSAVVSPGGVGSAGRQSQCAAVD